MQRSARFGSYEMQWLCRITGLDVQVGVGVANLNADHTLLVPRTRDGARTKDVFELFRSALILALLVPH